MVNSNTSTYFLPPPANSYIVNPDTNKYFLPAPVHGICSKKPLITNLNLPFRGLYHWQLFARNSNSMETLPCCNSIVVHQTATNFCTCHDSTAVLSCAKFCSYGWVKIKVRMNQILHWIWNVAEITLVKWAPELRTACLAVPSTELSHSSPPSGFSYRPDRRQQITGRKNYILHHLKEFFHKLQQSAIT